MSEPLNGSAQFKSNNAFRRSAESRLKDLRKAGVAGYEELRRRFVFERLLALIFDPAAGIDEPGPRWILKGGTGLLMRLPEARYSRDIDLIRVKTIDPAEAVDELRRPTAARPGDHLTFTIAPRWKPAQGHQGIVVAVTASIGAKWAEFSIDLALDSHAVAAPDRVRPTPVMEMPGLAPTPEFVLYALADQVADKVGAMYERHGAEQWASSRFRDMVDLALIVSSAELDAEPLLTALAAQPSHRPALPSLPTALVVPGPDWAAGYRTIALDAPLPDQLRSLDPALAYVGECLNPLLSGSRDSGHWRPGDGWMG